MNRRDFLKTTSIGGFAAMLGGCANKPEPKAQIQPKAVVSAQEEPDPVTIISTFIPGPLPRAVFTPSLTPPPNTMGIDVSIISDDAGKPHLQVDYRLYPYRRDLEPDLGLPHHPASKLFSLPAGTDTIRLHFTSIPGYMSPVESLIPAWIELVGPFPRVEIIGPAAHDPELQIRLSREKGYPKELHLQNIGLQAFGYIRPGGFTSYELWEIGSLGRAPGQQGDSIELWLPQKAGTPILRIGGMQLSGQFFTDDIAGGSFDWNPKTPEEAVAQFEKLMEMLYFTEKRETARETEPYHARYKIPDDQLRKIMDRQGKKALEQLQQQKGNAR